MKAKSTLYEYQEIISRLPLKNKYTKEELLIEEFLVDEQKEIEIYYAPHNEYFNAKAKIFIIGITPGFQQMSTAIVTAKRGLEDKKSIAEIQYACKAAARFSGSLRKNIISMLDDIGLGKVLGINGCSQLFGERDDLLHTVSLIPYPTFVKKENYSGHTPKLIKSPFLMKYVRENFIHEFEKLEKSEEVVLIPLGKAVEEVLCQLAEEEIVSKEQILVGFPHPSGANVNRLIQFEACKEEMKKFINKIRV